MSTKENPNEDFPVELFAETLLIAEIPYFARDLRTNRGFWSDALFRLLGYEPGEVQPHFALVLARVHPEDREGFQRWKEELLEIGGISEREYRILRPDGQNILVRSRVRIQRDAHGVPLKTFGILQDLSHEEAINARIRESENALKEAQRIAKIGSWTHDLEKKEYSWSDEMFRIAGIPRQEIKLKRLLSLVHPEDLARLLEAGKASMEGEEYINLELRIQRPDGEIRHIQNRWRSIKDETGKEIKRIGTIQDITEKKIAEMDRLKLERKILEIEKLESLGLLAGGIAHDFNNLLTGILGNAELLLEALPHGTKQRSYVRGILSSAEEASELVRNLLDFAGKRKGSPRPLAMKQVVENTLSLLRPLLPPQVKISLDFQDPIPPIQGDPLRLRQALMNLILNGVEAIGQREGNLWVRLGKTSSLSHPEGEQAWRKWLVSERDLTRENALMIEIEDDGEGMSPETLDQIFEPFFTTKFSGHGIGLASTLEIIRSHGGQIDIRSQRGEGSLFRILLPVTSPPDLDDS